MRLLTRHETDFQPRLIHAIERLLTQETDAGRLDLPVDHTRSRLRHRPPHRVIHLPRPHHRRRPPNPHRRTDPPHAAALAPETTQLERPPASTVWRSATGSSRFEPLGRPDITVVFRQALRSAGCARWPTWSWCRPVRKIETARSERADSTATSAPLQPSRGRTDVSKAIANRTCSTARPSSPSRTVSQSTTVRLRRGYAGGSACFAPAIGLPLCVPMAEFG